MAYGDTFRALTDEQFIDGLKEQSETIIALLARKRASYGPDNLTRFGDFGILVRVGDKVERLAHMHRQGIDTTAVDESADDAWTDILGYALLRALVMETERYGPIEDDSGPDRTSDERIERIPGHEAGSANTGTGYAETPTVEGTDEGTA